VGTTHGARVNSQAVILILDNSITNSNAVTLANIKGIGIMTPIIITVRVIDRDSVQDQVIRLNAKGLDRRVLDI
jgi:hypothetical protein